MKDPEMMAAMSNPKVMAAMQQCMGNPMAAMQYMNDPEVGPVLQKMMSKMMSNPAMAGMAGGMPGGMPGMGGMGGMPGGMVRAPSALPSEALVPCRPLCPAHPFALVCPAHPFVHACATLRSLAGCPRAQARLKVPLPSRTTRRAASRRLTSTSSCQEDLRASSRHNVKRLETSLQAAHDHETRGSACRCITWMAFSNKAAMELGGFRRGRRDGCRC